MYLFLNKMLFLLQTKKFYTIRNELKRVSDLCQRQHTQIKEYKKIIKNYEEEQGNQSMSKV